MERKTGNPFPFILRGSPLLLWPLLLSWALSGSHIRSVLFSCPALLKPPLPRNCRLTFPLPKLRRMRIRCGAAISSLNTSPRPNRAFWSALVDVRLSYQVMPTFDRTINISSMVPIQVPFFQVPLSFIYIFVYPALFVTNIQGVITYISRPTARTLVVTSDDTWTVCETHLCIMLRYRYICNYNINLGYFSWRLNGR